MKIKFYAHQFMKRNLSHYAQIFSIGALGEICASYEVQSGSWLMLVYSTLLTAIALYEAYK